MTKRDVCIDRLRQRAKDQKDVPAYFSESKGTWKPVSWQDYHSLVRQFAKSLLSLGFKPDGKVSILGFNRLEWLISAIGAQYAAGVSVGVYTASSKDEVAYVVDHSDSEVLVVENLERYQKQVRDIRSNLSKIKLIVLMSDEKCAEPGVVNFSKFMSMGKDISDETLEQLQSQIDPKATATMIYTSGTTGNPKSVMLSHDSIAWTVRTVVQAWRCDAKDRLVSYLPLAHVAEQMLSLYAPIECGMTIYFAPSFEALRATITDVEPTVFFGVPRVYEKMHDAVKTVLAEQGQASQKLLAYLCNITGQYYRAQNLNRMPSFWINSQYHFAAKKVLQKVRKKLGLGKARICVCGAAPISKDILNFFFTLDIPVYEVYGQSENAGPATFNVPGQTKVGAVGKPLAGSDVKIAEDGEILIRGPHVFSGYYKDPAATLEVLKDGWLCTGDVGTFDKDGFLRITDRKKDLLITAGGKNISPQNLEAMLKKLPYVQSAVVVGDSKKYLCALLSPDLERVRKKALELGKAPEDAMAILSDKLLHQEIQKELEKMNSLLAPVEQIKRFALLPNEFSVDSGEFTPTMKVKRKFVNQKYLAEIEKMYQ